MFKQLCHFGKTTLASLFLISPFAVQAAVDMNITSFTDNPDPAVAGGVFHYLLTVENSGDQDAPNAGLSVTIPAEVTVLSVTPSGTCNGTSPVICNFGTLTGTLAGGSPVNIDITLLASSAGPLSISSTATVSTSASDGNGGNDNSTQGTTINRGADLAVIFNGSTPTTASAGSSFDYVIDILNNGPNDAADQKIVLQLPPEVTYQSGGGSGWSCSASGQIVTCNRSSVLANAAAAPSLSVTAKVTGSSIGTFTALATVSSTTDDGDGNNNSATHDLTVTAGADVAISKSVSPDPVIAEQAVTFTLAVTNNGPMSSDSVVVTDTLPADYTAISASGTGWTCNVAGQTVTCNADASLPQGSAPVIIINATAPLNAQIPAAGDTHSNTASLTSSTPDPVSGNDTDTVFYNIGRNQADLSISKSKTPNPVAQGSAMSSIIQVTNNGPQTATGPIKVEDTLAAGESYNQTTNPGTGSGWSCSYSLADDATGGVVTCTHAGSLALNAQTPVLTIPTKAVGTGAMQNTACTSGSAGQAPPENDFNTTNDCATAGGTTSTAATADLELTKTVDDPNSDGTLQDTESTLTYTLTVTNRNDTGDTGDAATNVVLTDPIPMYGSNLSTYGTTGVIATPSQGTCSIGSTVSCNLGTIANGASANVVITVTRPMKDGTWTNNASAFSQDIGDPDRTNNAASATTIVEPVADVAVTAKSQSGPVLAGVEATYVISFKNNGVSAAQNIEVIDTFTNLNGMTYTFISATSNLSGMVCTHDAPTKKVTCTGGQLTPALAKSVTIKIRPDYNTSLTYPLNLENTATITTSTLESDGPAGAVNPNNSQTATLVVKDAKIDMLVQKQDFVDPLFYDSATPANNVITYEIKVTNQGPSYGTGIQFVDTLTPATGQTLTFLCDKALQGDSCTPSTPGQICNLQGTAISSPTNITCNLPDMATGAISYRYLDFRVDSAPASGGTTVQNSVTVSSNEPEGLGGNNTASDQTTVRVRADVEVTSKTPEFATVNINQPFNWTIVVTNNGPDISEATTLDDTLPAGMVLTGSAVPAQGTCPTGLAGETIISCDLGLMNNGATTTITVPVKITTFAASYNNTASVTTSAVDQVPANNSKTSSVTVQQSSLAGFVYADNNDDALKGSGENGIAGVTLTLTGTDIYGNVLNITRITDGSGAFLFDSLPPSNGSGYTITETHPSGYVDGQENAAGTIVPNSHTTDVISAIALPANTALTGYLFGELGSSSTTGLLSGYVYNDGSDDGDRTGNPGIENVTITLTGTDTNGAVNLTTTTAANGSYSFPNLLPGTYTLTQTQPAGYDDHIDTVGQIGGSDVGTLGNDVISNIILPAGGVGTEYNFADSNTAITGFVYVDANNDGIKDSGEAAIPGVTITLTGNDTNGTPVSLTTTTDSNGAYSFTGILASDANGYTVTETQPTAWADGKDAVGNAGGSAATNDQINGILIGSSTRAADYNFGELGAALSGIVYNDNGDDGQKEASDPGIPGVTITLTGTDLNGNPVSRTIVTDTAGHYRFDNLPVPDANGFTITETQPTGINDGKENTSNLITGVQITTPGVEETGFNFGEIIPSAQTASVSGRVHDRDNPNKTYAGWTVEIIKNGVVIATAITDANNGYLFEGLQPGPGYEIHFRHPDSHAVFGVLKNVTLTANTELPDQNFPLDPSGVVYDSVTRQPVPGAIVTISGPPGFNPATDLIGGAGNVSQTVGADGMYKYLLNPTAPAGVYSLAVIQPTGYLPPTSLNIPAPCTGSLVVGATPAPAIIQPQATAPGVNIPLHNPASCPSLGASGTQYYLSFNLNAASADVVNNHIPLDPAGAVTGLTIVKSTPKANVTRGELVPYSIRVTNNLTTPITNIRIRDLMPPGFKYVTNSATLDGQKNNPQINNRELTWPTQDYAVGESHEVKLILVIGAGVGEGEYTNQALGINGLTGATATSIAEATVRIVPDPIFDCSDLIGKVFDDKNTNGYQDEGEKGLPGIRVVTARGLVITTDANGRYHVPCAAVPNEMRGSNFILKLDEQTLPSGYRVTTENPRVVRLTRGKLAKLNFGAAIHRVVRLDLSAKAFDQDSDQLRDSYDQHLQKLIDVLSQQPSVLRVAYATSGESKVQVKQRLINFRKQLKSMWGHCDCNNELIIEEEVLWESTTTRGSASTGRAK